MEFLEQYPYVIKYKKDSTNIVVDALSSRHALFSKLGVQILGFDNIIELYKEDHDFASIFAKCEYRAQGGFYVSEGYLFKEGKFVFPKESQEGGLMGPFGVDKTLELLKGKFFWSYMRRDVQRHCFRCISCLKAKSKAMPHGFYTHLPFASAPWEDISIDFIIELPRTTKGFDSIFMVVDRFFFREVVKLHGLSQSIVLDRDPKFEDHFLRILLEKLGTKLKFSIFYHPQTNGQNEVENIALSTMPTVIMRDNHNSRDAYLSHIEFEYNRVVHKTTNISPFEAVYRFNHLSPLDLLPFPNPQEFVPKEGVTTTEFVNKMHERIKEQIQQQTEKYHEKLPKTIEKQKEWQLNKIDFYTTTQTNSFALFDNSH